MGEEQIHKRRVRYKGTHPRKFSEKYKELNPEKYGDTIEKVISKGSTPAGMHIPIMVEEILDVLKVQPGDVGLDATLGYGGHSGKILEKLKEHGIPSEILVPIQKDWNEDLQELKKPPPEYMNRQQTVIQMM